MVLLSRHLMDTGAGSPGESRRGVARLSARQAAARPDGSVAFRKKLSRAKVLGFLASQQPCAVEMEACGGAHHWDREIGHLGHAVQLVPPACMKAYVNRHGFRPIVIGMPAPGMGDSAVRVPTRRHAGMNGEEVTLPCNIEWRFEDGRWQVLREPIFLHPLELDARSPHSNTAIAIRIRLASEGIRLSVSTNSLARQGSEA